MTVVALGLLALLAAQCVEFFSFRSAQKAEVQTQATQTAQAFKTEMETLLSRVEAEGVKLGEEFAQNDYNDAQVRERIKDVSLSFAEIQGVTACYEPFGLSPDMRLYCPYYSKATGDYFNVETSYDYTERRPGTLWYGGVIDNGAGWAEPYFGDGAQDWFVDFGVPFNYRSGEKAGTPQGIIDFSLQVGDFQSIVHKLIVGKASYSFITSPKGMFLSHPVDDFVGTKTLQDALEDETLSPGLREAFTALQNAESGVVSYTDDTLRDQALVHYDTLDDSGFGMVTVFFEKNLSDSQKAKHRRYIQIALTLSLVLIIGSIRYFARDELDRGEIEGLSVATTLILLANVLLIGGLQHSLDAQTFPTDSPAIVDTSALGGIISAENARAETLKLDEPTVIPTGLYIERLEFADSYNVNMGGVIWQKYPSRVVDDIDIGIRLPQMSPFAEAAFLEESYRRTVEGKEGEASYLLVGYDFRVTLRLNLSYRDYPFDKRHLDIRLAPASRTDNVLLVPDLAGYSDTNPTSLSGIDPDVKLPGNRIVETYFNFSFEEFETDFGYGASGSYSHMPLLHFNIHQKRYLLNAFVTYLIPVFVTLSLIYILIFACEKTEARQGIIESMAAFFFVLIFSHIDLRKDIVTADLIFMEYFYFITYLMIILSTFNLITYTKSRVNIFDHNENQIYRAVYFPLFLSLILIVMFNRFY
jgi:hypothetical protein